MAPVTKKDQFKENKKTKIKLTNYTIRKVEASDHCHEVQATEHSRKCDQHNNMKQIHKIVLQWKSGFKGKVHFKRKSTQ